HFLLVDLPPRHLLRRRRPYRRRQGVGRRQQQRRAGQRVPVRIAVEVRFYLLMTKVPGSEDSLYFASPAAKVALKAYEPDFCVSLRLTDAWPFASVVAVAVCAPRAKLTFLPATGWPYSSTRSAASTIVFEGPDEIGPVYPSVVSRFVTWAHPGSGAPPP